MWYYLFFKNIQYIQIYILDVFNILETWFKQFKECISNSTSSVIHFVSIWQPVFLWCVFDHQTWQLAPRGAPEISSAWGFLLAQCYDNTQSSHECARSNRAFCCMLLWDVTCEVHESCHSWLWTEASEVRTVFEWKAARELGLSQSEFLLLNVC